jgi:two-component system KDP operon response regulator KdpE
MVVSACGEQHVKVRALDLGADDYLAKPFGMDEFLARVRARFRRQVSADHAAGMLHSGSLIVDLDTRQAIVAGVALDLTPREFDILAYLMRNAGQVVPHRVLLRQVWGPEYGDETHYLRVFINRLRRKIERNADQPRAIVTYARVGYAILQEGSRGA